MTFKKIQVLLLAIFISSCSYGQPATNGTVKDYFGSDRTISEVDRFLQSKMDSLHIPGLSFALINNGDVVHHKTFGYADRESKKPVTSQTIFEAASLSKSVFAFFAMTYVEDGKLDLDKPLYEYLPYPDIADDDRYKKITARMVLSHRSGFPNWRFNEPDGKLKIYFEPGTDYKYSGEGYQYLAKVLREIENTDWEGLENIFQQKIGSPLNLEHTVFLQTPFTRANKAIPYDENGQRLTPSMNNREFGAAYSIHTEAADFSKWMIAVMNKEILAEESYSELFKRHSKLPNNERDVYYTLGFTSPEIPGTETNIYMHNGNNPGFTCMYLLDIEKDWGFALFTNSEFGQDLGNELGDYLIPEPK
ncbi:serine hydrolase domain-containing protein [Rhodohalobacter sp. 614A]|uniref:serine hydrolase domain-containing protein n=1 Tax=Rhodohalobacter sp. 614A TaxID=2908649 RepID=UPI001F3E6E2F|nr:serine hydrolase domain-containing protein [Rhodohalobacter sp. 614A]